MTSTVRGAMTVRQLRLLAAAVLFVVFVAIVAVRVHTARTRHDAASTRSIVR